MKSASPPPHPNDAMRTPVPFQEHDGDSLDLDRTLTEIRSGRRLEKIVSCIEGFLNSQISRLEKGVAECESAVDNDRIVQKILADFELEKQDWEAKRQAETTRLREAGEKLIKGWEQLENERRDWVDQRDDRGAKNSR